jgi:simple sugar transport system substrate-binding protein
MEVLVKKIDPVVDETIETLNMKDGPSRRRLLEGAGLFSATAAASALIAACTSSGSSSASPSASATSSAAKALAGNFPKTPGWEFWFVNHATTNAFFTPTQYGMADAAALLGLPAPKWTGSPTSATSVMVSDIQTAISAGAAGIAVAVIDNTSFTAPIASAMSAGIPVLSYNADGIYVNGVASIGSNRLAYVGQALYLSGQAMGNQIKTLVPGGGDIVIFIATPGTGNIQPRVDGAKSVLGSNYKVHEVATSTDTSTELSTEKAYLLGNKSTKGAFAVDGGSSENLPAALKGAGVSIPAGVFDTEPQTLTGLQDGTLSFTIYQDPYLQGFLPVLYFYLYNLSGATLTPPDTDTGLTVVTKDNLAPFQKNSRYQGASSAELYIPRPSGAISNPPATTST